MDQPSKSISEIGAPRSRRRLQRRTISVILAIALSLLAASTASAWSGTNSASYANTWWDGTNLTWKVYADDCANFVSQAVFAGGYPMNYSTHNPWYGNYGYTKQYSSSWGLVAYQNGFFLNDSPGGYIEYEYTGVKTASPVISVGDIVYYDWYGSSSFAPPDGHVAIITVKSGRATSTSDVGALVDAHNADRYHEYWTLWYFNSNWWRTFYEIVHLSSSN